MKISRKLVFLCFGIGLIFSLNIFVFTAPFQYRRGFFSVTPFIGVNSGFRFGQLNPVPGSADVPEVAVLLENTGTVSGMSLEFPVTRHLEFQGKFIYARSEIIEDVGIGFAGVPLGKEKISNAEIFSYAGNLLYYLPVKEKFSFYLVVGLGSITIKTDSLSSPTKLLLNYGCGLKLKLSRHIYPVLDLRDYVSFFDFYKDIGLAYAAIYTEDINKTQHSIGIHLGLRFVF
ncbi:outer membrane beta-barrel protein [Acidobacteriota bacterium]